MFPENFVLRTCSTKYVGDGAAAGLVRVSSGRGRAVSLSPASRQLYLQYLHRISTISTQYIYLATISTLLRVAAWPRPALRPRHEATGGGVAARGGGVALLARLSEPVTAHGTLEYL